MGDKSERVKIGCLGRLSVGIVEVDGIVEIGLTRGR